MSKPNWIGILLVLSLTLITSSYAQSSGAAKVYRDQFAQLHLRTKAVLARAEEQGKSASASDGRVALEIQEEINALTKLTNTLGEDAGRSYVEGLRRALDSAKEGRTPQDPSKSLLFVGSGCEEMTFTLGALYNYMESGDRAFLGFAKKGDELTSSIEAVL